MKYFHQISFSNFHLHLWKCNIRLCENNDCARNASFTFSSLAEFDYLNKEQPPWSLLLCLKLLWKTLLGSFQSSSNSLVWSLSFRFIITKILTKACNKAKMMENDLIEKYDFFPGEVTKFQVWINLWSPLSPTHAQHVYIKFLGILAPLGIVSSACYRESFSIQVPVLRSI